MISLGKGHPFITLTPDKKFNPRFPEDTGFFAACVAGLFRVFLCAMLAMLHSEQQAVAIKTYFK
ncbi:hypothetical protein WAE56_05865 [Iodobacter sp. LRB]|uniref:hypothetical protein n=1 Tax=unclassified Iodobacter TaxID=235634 RepID=UPI000C111621|nr:hypothetical protein [Iodobacter sp. BJB302]PHV02249.1 hypothetical protein CSQ88_08220 [Iodobacter sp. BJB302]